MWAWLETKPTRPLFHFLKEIKLILKWEGLEAESTCAVFHFIKDIIFEVGVVGAESTNKLF